MTLPANNNIPLPGPDGAPFLNPIASVCNPRTDHWEDGGRVASRRARHARVPRGGRQCHRDLGRRPTDRAMGRRQAHLEHIPVPTRLVRCDSRRGRSDTRWMFPGLVQPTGFLPRVGAAGIRLQYANPRRAEDRSPESPCERARRCRRRRRVPDCRIPSERAARWHRKCAHPDELFGHRVPRLPGVALPADC